MKKKILAQSLNVIILSSLSYHTAANAFFDLALTGGDLSYRIKQVYNDQQPIEKENFENIQTAINKINEMRSQFVLAENPNNSPEIFYTIPLSQSYFGEHLPATSSDDPLYSSLDNHFLPTPPLFEHDNPFNDPSVIKSALRVKDAEIQTLQESAQTTNEQIIELEDGMTQNKSAIDSLGDQVGSNKAYLDSLDMAIADTNKNLVTSSQENKAFTADNINQIKNDLIDSKKQLNKSIDDAIDSGKKYTSSSIQANNKFILDRSHETNIKYSNQFKKLNQKINKTAKQANAGIASVAAMSNIPYTTNSRFSAGIGLGNYKNGQALAAGAQYQIKENLNIRSSVSWNNADSAAIGAGVAMGW